MQMSEKTVKTVYDFASIFLNAILAVTLIFTFAFKISVVNGSSMENTLSHGDRLVLTAKDWDVAYGDIVVISVVNGSSMENTLSHGDRLVLTAKDWDVAYGDIVVISQPNGYGEVLIKRVIATEGQSIYIDPNRGHVVVDGQLLNEPYIAEAVRTAGDMQYPITVPKGCVFVMGDNRNHSGDSRSKEVGFIDTRYIVGEAVYRMGDTHLLNFSMEKENA